MGMMSIRAIGSPTASVGSVAGAYVDYLTSGVQSQGKLAANELDGTVSYYDSGIEGPGVWSGHGAQRLGLAGFVEPEDLKNLLAGRHHETGERLLSAQGSAGRYSLKVGAPTREIDGQPVWSRHDLEGHLNLDGEVLDQLLEDLDISLVRHDDALYIDAEAVDRIDGYRIETQDSPLGQPSRDLDGKPVWSVADLAQRTDLDGNVLDTLLSAVSGELVEHDQQEFLSKEQAIQFSDAVDNLARLDHLRGLKPDALLGAGESAELVGVSRRYLAKVIGHHHDYEANNIELDDRDKDWLPAHKVDPENPNSHWRIRADDLAAFIERRQPPAVRIGYDVTFSFEKSVSVVGMLSEGADRDAFTQAVQRANHVGIDWLDQHASDGRERAKPIHSEGLAVASFMHSTSRSDDPFVHVHNLVINAIEDQNGTGRALDARDLYMQGPTAAALASAELRWQLSQSLGVKWTATGKAVEIAGISEGIIEEFSTGRNRIHSIVEEAGFSTNDSSVRDLIQRQSRPDKTGDAPDDLVDGWWERSNRRGLHLHHLEHEVKRQPDALPASTLSDNELEQLHTWLAGRHGATNNASIFTHGDIVQRIGEWTPKGNGHVRIMPAAEVNRAADAFLTSPHVVPLALDSHTVATLAGKTAAKMQHSEVFTTARMLDIQQGTADTWADGLHAEQAHVSPEALRTALANVPTITAAQAELVTRWTTSGHQFQSAVGVPGAGKTFAVSAAARAWEHDGYTVIGAAVAGSAAQHLGEDANIPSETLAYYLNQISAHGNTPFDANTVLIVDEAGTIPDEDLSYLLHTAADLGTTVRFLGDPEQHGAVNAGGMWKHLTNEHSQHTPQLLESHRFKDSPIDVELNDLVRAGNIEGALRLLRDNGRLFEADSEQEALSINLRIAVHDREQGKANPLIERRNSNRVLLNESMQQIRVDRGEVTQITEYGHRKYGVGDEIISKANDRTLYPANNDAQYLRNGTQGVITAIAQNGTVTADFGKGEITIPAQLLETSQFQLAYSLTSNAVQGATLPKELSHIKPGASKAEILTNLSRGREENRTTISGHADEEQSQFHEPDQRTLATQVAESISPAQDIPATIADPHANDRTNDLPRLESQLALTTQHNNQHTTDTDETPDERVRIHRDIRLAQDQLAREVLVDPPSELTNALPPRSNVPHLAHSYDNALIQVAIYNATYQPQPGPGPWGQLLGQQPIDLGDNNRRTNRYDQAITALTNAATKTATRSIDDHDPRPLPQWVPEHLQQLAHDGNLTPNFNPAAFIDWAHKANAHQHSTGVIPRSDTTHAVTSTDPTHNTLATRHANALHGNTHLTAPPAPDIDIGQPAIETPARGISL